MIVADSSVWISLFRKDDVDVADRLRSFIPQGVVLVGDIIMLEVLQGARDSQQARWIEQNFRDFPVAQMLSPSLAIKAAANYRTLRDRGVTVRKTIDMIIGTYCIEHRHSLLQRDKDYLPMVEHLGLQIA
ncbi:PIN domain nuclease [Neorhizobium galegae]|uniref:type II toxin-antitoxin system VapC family toxin n=1 Tax=Neorhizobium galegae TaxID=399 RepID=UPI0006210DFA|nr:PIN domain nuclease [Neorhizobium galegae]CDZ29356.1 Putative nucleic acid-binding protein [Neorhizobium galegae bv. officinalis]KAA9386453.1 PIN domain nuclease [Neorhizobium galegae]KAB1112692.1 PIN domain nuclease [Neorhizobium galegae]MCM2500622.1 PIN domain nuclease [Neorhizobium galegae]MCQ1764684.1 PIN domain nuclease [Neorhizobium galegae]